MQFTAGKTTLDYGSIKSRKLTGKALWPFFGDVPASIGQAGHIELLHQIVPPLQGEERLEKELILLKVCVLRFATVADT